MSPQGSVKRRRVQQQQQRTPSPEIIGSLPSTPSGNNNSRYPFRVRTPNKPQTQPTSPVLTRSKRRTSGGRLLEELPKSSRKRPRQRSSSAESSVSVNSARSVIEMRPQQKKAPPPKTPLSRTRHSPRTQGRQSSLPRATRNLPSGNNTSSRTPCLKPIAASSHVVPPQSNKADKIHHTKQRPMTPTYTAKGQSQMPTASASTLRRRKRRAPRLCLRRNRKSATRWTCAKLDATLGDDKSRHWATTKVGDVGQMSSAKGDIDGEGDQRSNNKGMSATGRRRAVIESDVEEKEGEEEQEDRDRRALSQCSFPDNVEVLVEDAEDDDDLMLELVVDQIERAENKVRQPQGDAEMINKESGDQQNSPTMNSSTTTSLPRQNDEEEEHQEEEEAFQDARGDEESASSMFKLGDLKDEFGRVARQLKLELQEECDSLVFMCLTGPSHLLGSLLCFRETKDARGIVVEEFRKLALSRRLGWRKADPEQLLDAVYGRCSRFFWPGATAGGASPEGTNGGRA